MPPQFITAGRVTWAFARDKGTPFHEFFSHVDTKLQFPARSTLLALVFISLYGLIYMASTTAFNSVINKRCPISEHHFGSTADHAGSAWSGENASRAAFETRIPRVFLQHFLHALDLRPSGPSLYASGGTGDSCFDELDSANPCWAVSSYHCWLVYLRETIRGTED
jgi:hypothetical protein